MSESENPLVAHFIKLFTERKVTKENAFELDLVAAANEAVVSAKGKNGFAGASTAIEAMQYVYGKKVDAALGDAQQLMEKFSGAARQNAGRVDENGEPSQQKQHRRRKQNQDEGDVDKRLCTNEELSMPRDARSCVLDNFLLDSSKERDGKLRESFIYKAPMYCGLVLGDAQPHKLFEEYEERPADPSLDLSEMLPALKDTLASLEALGDDPFPQLKKWLPQEPDPVVEALKEVMAGMSVSVQCGPVPGAPLPPTTACRTQRTPAEHQMPHDPCSSAIPAASGEDTSRLSSGAAAAPDDFPGTSQQQPQSHSPAEPLDDGWDATQAVADSQPAADAAGWEDGFDGGFDGFDGGDDWGDIPLDTGADDMGTGVAGDAAEMSQAMQWLMQPQRADVPMVNLSWADKSAWRFGAPPRDPSATTKTAKKAAPATRAKKAKVTSRCTGPDDEEHFPRHKPGKTYQLSAKKLEEMAQLAAQAQLDEGEIVKERPMINFEERFEAYSRMLADQHRPAESKRNQRAAMADGDLDAAALWADDDDAGGMHDNHDATAGYCDYDGGDDGGDYGYEDWSAGPDNGDLNANEDTENTGGNDGGFTACAEAGGSEHPRWGLLSPLAQNVVPVAVRGGTKLNYARRRKPVKAAELKSCLWDSFVEHRQEQTDDPVAQTQQDILTQPELAPVPTSDVAPEEVDWQTMLNDIQDGDWGKVEDSSVHMCYFLTLVLANERELRLRDAGSIEQGHRIMLRQEE